MLQISLTQSMAFGKSIQRKASCQGNGHMCLHISSLLLVNTKAMSMTRSMPLIRRFLKFNPLQYFSSTYLKNVRIQKYVGSCRYIFEIGSRSNILTYASVVLHFRCIHSFTISLLNTHSEPNAILVNRITAHQVSNSLVSEKLSSNGERPTIAR